MSTYPQESVAQLAQSLAGSAIQDAYADTGNGTGDAIGAFPRAIASGALAVAGAITTLTIKLAVRYPGSDDLIDVLSSKPGESTPAVEHTYTTAGPWCLLTSNHAGGVLFVLAKGDTDGTSGDAFTAYTRGATP